MYNWSVDEEKLKKYPESYEIWKLEQAVNFGLSGQKISKKSLEKYWSKLFIEDPYRKAYLELVLWGKKY